VNARALRVLAELAVVLGDLDLVLDPDAVADFGPRLDALRSLIEREAPRTELLDELARTLSSAGAIVAMAEDEPRPSLSPLSPAARTMGDAIDTAGRIRGRRS
jgi:hypothetical protein